MTLAMLAQGPAWAHRLRPAIVTFGFAPDGAYEVSIVLNMEALLAGIGPEHEDTNEAPNAREYDNLRLDTPAQLRQRIDAFAETYLDGVTIEFNGRRSRPELISAEVPEVGDRSVERLTTLTLRGTVPPGASTLRWSYAQAFGDNALRVGPAGQEPIQSVWLTAGAASEPIPLGAELAPRSRWQVTRDYLGLGFTHILPKGLDHILFVLGIFLLSLEWRPLLYQVTAFTVAHSITLGLSLYGIVSLSPAIVEPLIALSIVYVAVENIVTRDLKPWRVWVVFAFGLLHGMGFAGVLLELGLPRNEFVTALIAFNVGVEFGQLAVITLAFLAVGLWSRHQSWYRSDRDCAGRGLLDRGTRIELAAHAPDRTGLI
jgi:hydrogenase/urease accessory protein HupE